MRTNNRQQTVVKKLYWFLFEYDLNQGTCTPLAKKAATQRVRLFSDLSKLVLFAYVLMMFNMVIPVAADALAHTFWEKEHLAGEHQQNGNKHVELTIAKMENSGAKGKPAATKTSTEDITHLLFVKDASGLMHFSTVDKMYPSYLVSYQPSVPDTDYPPPRV
ncbi:hypothetical protein [Mucilaginibacter pedocola]|uniref:Uncharacterized protein n=1 Tax=Mucilaginibacter pedocola TaxID=1792845 RepID=A0A1S9PAP0_9SPHI|nr:hypothetical protein [Mucilaginibacter pedocola]OOQ57999.1 hypothetical protein BC343_10050 [Mucilaginibacter pedocola]